MRNRHFFRLLTATALWLLMATHVPAVIQSPAAEERGFSKGFVSASIRQLEDSMLWKESIVKVVQYNAPPGTWLDNYRLRAAESLEVASAQAATPGDAGALELLRNQFNNLQLWNNNAVAAQQAGHNPGAANAAVIKDDPLFSRISDCSKFLGTMLTSGSFTDHPACH